MASDLAVRAFYEKVCTESLPKSPLFGSSLDKYMELQKKTIPFMNEPWIVRKCCDYLRDNGLKTEGIFRVPGSTSAIKKISDAFDAGQNPDFGNQQAFVEDVAGVLKKYLRDLPEPLISDGTEEDSLQKAFHQVSIELEDADDLGPYLSKLNQLLKQLPRFRQAVVCDLYHLFACIVAYQNINLMSSDNVATIFGGMTNIMTSSMLTGPQRSRLVRVLIDNYETCFHGVYELEESKLEEPGAKETKEGIRVYWHDGTFKSLFCQSSEVGKDIFKKVMAKIQQTTDVNAEEYHMYEIRDAMWRLVGDNEKVLPILKSGSALLITNELKGERSEKPTLEITSLSQPTNTAASATTTTTSTTSTSAAPATSTKLSIGNVTKPKRDKKDRSPRNAESVTPPQSTSSTPTPTITLSRSEHVTSGLSALARPSPRETNTPPIAFGSSISMMTWVFPSIPIGSVKATEWDPAAVQEGQVEMKCTPSGSSVVVMYNDVQRNFIPIQMTPVEDSTRYFMMGSELHQSRIGLGFETRDDAMKFRNTLSQMIQYDQIHAIDAEPSAQLDSVLSFAKGPLGFHMRMEEGFYDLGVIPTGTKDKSPSLREIAQSSLDMKSPEVILVNKAQDGRLDRFVTVASKLVPPRADVEERARVLAMFVSNVLGGIDISDGVGSLDDQDSPYASLEGISRDSICSLRTRTKSNIVKLGNVTHGVRRHRSILFKYIADRLDPILPSALARTVPTSPAKGPSYAIIIPYARDAKCFTYLDLVTDPGFAYPPDSAVATSFAMHLHGTLPETPKSYLSRLELSHSDVTNAWYLSNHITHPPRFSPETPTRIFEQIGSSETSVVYRGAIGTVPVTIKESPLSDNLTADDFATIAASQCELSHDHIVATYGFKIENGVARTFREYIGLGSLLDQVKIARGKTRPLDDLAIWNLAHEIVTGLKYLHSKNLVHGNLSTTNILLDGDYQLQNYTVVKLADPLLLYSRTSHTAHNDAYRAPETLSNPAPSKAADIWSVGVIIAELVADHPFTTEELKAALDNADAEFGVFSQVITECCAADPAQRRDISALAETIQIAVFPPVSPHPSS